MTSGETIVAFDCDGDRAYGVLSAPAASSEVGFLVIGRVGSDRGAVHICRGWAQRGITSFRFDFRGRGDCEGRVVTVEETGVDLRYAIRAFRLAAPGIQRVVIWGLSEGGAAALLYAHKDPAVAGIVLVNPWIRMELAVATQHLKTNVGRMTDRAFWDRIRQSEAGYFGAARSLGRLVRNIAAAPKKPDTFKERVLSGLVKFEGPVCIILSGQDPATEVFRNVAADHLKILEKSGRLTIHNLREANHVFSRSDWREQLAKWTADWFDKTIPSTSKCAGKSDPRRASSAQVLVQTQD
jgi:exosortase A-associated hydrolase 1